MDTMFNDIDIVEFFESVDYDDPEQMEIVESVLDLIEEGSAEDSAAAFKKVSGVDKLINKIADTKDLKKTVDRTPDEDKAVKKMDTAVKGGVGVAALVALIASATGIAKAVKKLGNSDPKVKEIIKEAEDLKDQVNKLKDQAKKGDINPTIANAKIKVLEKKAEVLTKKAEELAAKKAEEKVKKESADDDLLEFVESADLDDPEQMAIVEAYLELIEEGSAEDSAAVFKKVNALDKTINKIADTRDLKKTVDRTPDEDKAVKKMDTAVGVGAGVAAAAALAVSIAGIATAIKKLGNDPEVKELLNEAKELQKEAADLRKEASKGDVNPKKAEVKAKILDKKAEKLQAKAEKLAAKKAEEKAKEDVKKESVDEIDIVSAKLAIYEAAMAGEITADEKDELLSVLAE